MSAAKYLRIEPGELSFVEPLSGSDHQRSIRVTNISEGPYTLVDLGL